MPTLSASDYTQYLKFKAAAASPIRPAIQTRTNATLSQSVLNANTLTSQAAFVTTPYTSRSTVVGTTVTRASSTPVIEARTDVLTAAVGASGIITYTSSVGHGLANGNVVTITGFADFADANVLSETVTVTNETTFTVPVAATGTATGRGSITGRVYYSTNIANGLVPGDTITISGISPFNATNATVLATTTGSKFVVSSTQVGEAVSGATGSIAGLVYYTTAAAHGLTAGAFPAGVGFSTVLNISELTTTPAFNLGRLTGIYRVPAEDVFIVSSSVTGTAITSQAGVLTFVSIVNGNNTLTGTSRVVPVQPMRTNNPNALSTLSGSGALSSSATQRPGGLPTGFKSSTSTYTRPPQQAGW